MHSLYLPGQLCNRPHSLETQGVCKKRLGPTRPIDHRPEGTRPETLYEEGNFKWTGKLDSSVTFKASARIWLKKSIASTIDVSSCFRLQVYCGFLCILCIFENAQLRNMNII